MYRRVPITIATVLVVCLAYATEIALAGSTAPNAAYGYLLSVVENHTIVLMLLSPILHSGHNHVTQNLLLFVPFAYLIERRTDSSVFLLFLLVVGYTGMIFNGILAGSIGVGISAIGFGLESREGTYRLQVIRAAKSDKEAMIHGFVFGVALILVLVGLAQAVGYLPASPGTAKAAHLIGILLGFTWAVFDLDSMILKNPRL